MGGFDSRDSRDVILEQGLTLISTGGFTGTGLDSVLKASGVPKGSFYYYFKSKEDFGIAVLERFADQLMGELESRLVGKDGAPLKSPLRALRGFFEDSVQELEKNRCASGCLIGNLTQELAGKSEPFRQRVEAIFVRWESIFEKYLREADRRGELSSPVKDFALSSRILLMGWQGAVLRSKAKGNANPIREWVKALKF